MAGSSYPHNEHAYNLVTSMLANLGLDCYVSPTQIFADDYTELVETSTPLHLPQRYSGANAAGCVPIGTRLPPYSAPPSPTVPTTSTDAMSISSGPSPPSSRRASSDAELKTTANDVSISSGIGLSTNRSENAQTPPDTPPRESRSTLPPSPVLLRISVNLGPARMARYGSLATLPSRIQQASPSALESGSSRRRRRRQTENYRVKVKGDIGFQE